MEFLAFLEQDRSELVSSLVFAGLSTLVSKKIITDNLSIIEKISEKRFLNPSEFDLERCSILCFPPVRGNLEDLF